MNQSPYKKIGNDLLGKIDEILKTLNNTKVPLNDQKFGDQLEDIAKEIVEARKKFKKDIDEIVKQRTPGVTYNPKVGLVGRNNSTININTILKKTNTSINLKSDGFPPIMSMDSIIGILKQMNKQKQNETKLSQQKNKRRVNILELRKLINGGNKNQKKPPPGFGTWVN
jgi:hypothetical protein